MAGGTAHKLTEQTVECPYCGFFVPLHDGVGTWITRCEPVLNIGQRGGCGREFVVTQTRTIHYSAKARRIEGE